MSSKQMLYTFLILFLLLVTLPACTPSQAKMPTEIPQIPGLSPELVETISSSTATISSQTTPGTIETAETNQPTIQSPLEIIQAATNKEPEEGDQQLLLPTTPELTATPGVITDFVAQVVKSTGIERTRFLGLTLEDWINLGISLLILLLSFLLVGHFIYSGLKKLVVKTPSKYDNLLLDSIKREISWVTGLLGLQIATARLLFLTPDLKQWLSKVYFALIVMAVAIILWKAVDIAGRWYREQAEEQGEEVRKDAVLVLVQRAIRFLIVVTGLIVIFQRIGINISGLLTALGIGGLALSLAAQDTLSNMVSGIIILMDQPFRVGDRIEIQGLDTWGDVVDIGLRSTRIRTLDNRMVIVPNSSISKNQVINYTFPDPRYRVQIEIGVAYGSDLKEVRQVITHAVRSVDGVISEKPVDVLFLEFGDSAMTLRIRWWIESYADSRRIFDKVNEAVYLALEKTGVEMPPPTMAVEITSKPDDSEKNSSQRGLN